MTISSAPRLARLGVLLAALGGVASSAECQTLNAISPRGARPGDEVEVTFYGRGLGDAVGVGSFHAGLGFEPMAAEDEKPRDDRVKFRVRVADDCPFGVKLVTLHTGRGITRVGTFHVGPLPVVAEDKGHDDLATAQLVDLNTTCEGRLEREDVDWWALEVTAGQRVVFEVQALRLGDSGVDVELELLDATGKLLRRADDSTFGMTDPVIAHTFEAAGRVAIKLRDVASGGSSTSFYRLHVGDFPRPVGAVPFGGRPGTEVAMRLIEPDGLVREAAVRIPDDPELRGNAFPVIDGRVPPTAIDLVTSGIGSLIEPGSDAGEGATEPPEVPVALEGVLAEPGEQDRFDVRLKKDDLLSIRSVSRRHRSEIDAVVSIYDANGKGLAGNDDSGGPDSLLRFKVPEDGVYQIGVRDLLGRGGPLFFYRIDVVREGGAFVLSQAVPGRYPEDGGVSVPRGGRACTVISASGLDRQAGIRLAFEGLPAGVTATVPAFVPGADVVPVVFESTPDAPLAFGRATPSATAEKEPVERRVLWRQGLPLVRVRNQQMMLGTMLYELPVAVAEPAPFRIDAEAPSAPIVRNAPMMLPFRLHRDEGFDDTVSIRVVWAPPGLSTGTARLGKGQTEGRLYMSARSNAALGTWPIVLAAVVESGGVRREVCSQVLPLEICDPWIGIAAPSVQLEQGDETVFVLQVEKKREFAGGLRIEPQRLPNGVTLEVPAEPDPAAATLELPLKVAADAALGRHRSHYFKVWVVTADGGEVLHHVGGGEIRVDKPLPPELRGDADGSGGQR